MINTLNIKKLLHYSGNLRVGLGMGRLRFYPGRKLK